ncbi:MAG: anaerobic ribonucleoside-triphosphate reductase activating protein [Firmicutes bacterium]|nr:anaerobic ribonucleoside-triphosphate reductase activating protein [Bacillota bacterium]
MSKDYCFRGVQKTSVIDFPGKVACVFFVGGCNFRCPFCYNISLVERTSPEIPWEEIWQFLNRRRTVLQGVVISGGEATLAPWLGDFLAKVKGSGLAVKLDTNGYKPDVLADLLERKLVDYVAMDIKNSPGKYAETAGLELMDMGKITESVKLLKDSGVAHEHRTTVAVELHTVADIEEIAAFCQGGERFSLQAVQPEPNLSGKKFTAPAPATMQQMATILRKTFTEVHIRP